MNSIDRSDPVILGRILADHRELFGQLSAVRTAFTQTARPMPTDVAAIQGSLGSLREYLRIHFEQEEEGGFMEESIARMPRLATAVQLILKQHPALLAEIDALIATLTPEICTPAVWAQAGSMFEQFSAQMLDHERSENTVVQDGYNEDLGLTD